ncbi:MAG: MFS transporter [Propionibacteriaceae bacterium]|nr:MFS transporter [Propionibacteriaceae bacterium]
MSEELMTQGRERQHWRSQVSWFLGSQAVSLLGSGLVQYALVWHLTMDSQSGQVMTLATIFGFLPMVALAPFGGVLADRYSRRLLIAGADALVAVSTVALFVAFLAGHGTYWMIFLIMAVRGLGQGVQMPAVGALLPQITPPEHLGRVNGFNSSIHATVTLVSPLLAGALLSVAPIQWVLLLDVVTAAVAIAILLILVRVPVPEGADAARGVHPLRDIASGLSYINRHRFVRRLLAYFAVLNFLAAPVSFLTPLQVTRTFSNEVWRLTAIEMAFAVGMMLGGVLVGWWGTRTRRVTTMGAAVVVLGALTVALGLPVSFVLYNLWMFLSGLFLPFMSTPAMTMIQLSVEDRFMGRVYSILMMVSVAAMPLGMAVMGPFADTVSVEFLLVVTGSVMAVFGMVLLVDRRARAGEPLGAGQDA